MDLENTFLYTATVYISFSQKLFINKLSYVKLLGTNACYVYLLLYTRYDERKIYGFFRAIKRILKIKKYY